MKKSNRSLLVLVVLGFGVLTGAAHAAYTWQAPSAPFPNGSISVPLDSGSDTQTKSGQLDFGLSLSNIFPINFGNNQGISAGAGFRLYPQWGGTDTILKNDNGPFSILSTGLGLPKHAGTAGMTTASGTIFYDTTDKTVKMYDGSAWQPIGAGATAPVSTGDSFWKQSGSLLYASDTAWNVGVGTETPTARLDVVGGDIVARGSNTSLWRYEYDSYVTNQSGTPRCTTAGTGGAVNCDVNNTDQDCSLAGVTMDQTKGNAAPAACYDYYAAQPGNFPYSVKFLKKQPSFVGGWVSGMTANGDVISFGGDNGGNDTEIRLNAPASRNFLSLWNRSSDVNDLSNLKLKDLYATGNLYLPTSAGKIMEENPSGNSNYAESGLTSWGQGAQWLVNAVYGNSGNPLSAGANTYKVNAGTYNTGAGIMRFDGNDKAWGIGAAPASTGVGQPVSWTELGKLTLNGSIWFSPRGDSSDFRVDNAGNTGIGVAPSSDKLHVGGSTKAEGDVVLGTNGTQSYKLGLGNTSKTYIYNNNGDTVIQGGDNPKMNWGNLDPLGKLFLQHNGNTVATFSSTTATFFGTTTVNGNVNATGKYYINGKEFVGGSGDTFWKQNTVNDVYASDTTWKVGIGTNSPAAKLSVVGNVTLLRPQGSSVPAGAGPAFTLESPSSNVSTQFGPTWVACGGAAPQPACASETVPTKDTDNAYTCTSDKAGQSFTADISKLGGTTQLYQNSVSCIAGTSAYSFRTNDGKLEFLNNGGTTQVGLTQAGNLSVVGGVKLGTAGGEADVTDVNYIKGYNDLFLLGNSAETAPIYYSGTEHHFYVGKNNERVTIAANGNLGVGTSTPQESLSVGGNVFVANPQGTVAGALVRTGVIGSSNSVSGNTQDMWIKLAEATLTKNYEDANADWNISPNSSYHGAQAQRLTVRLRTNGVPKIELHDIGLTNFEGNGCPVIKDARLVEESNTTPFVWSVWIQFGCSWLRSVPVTARYAGSWNDISLTQKPQVASITDTIVTQYAPNMYSAASDWTVGGNIGIGTTTPKYKLTVVGSTRIVDGTQAAGRYLKSDANGVASWADIPAATNYWVQDSNNNLYPVELGRNVGIGTTSPSRPLTVAGNMRSEVNGTGAFTAGTLELVDGGNHAEWDIANVGESGAEGRNSLAFQYSPTGSGGWSTPMLIDSLGHVGIGNTGVVAKLNIGAPSDALLRLERQNGIYPTNLRLGTDDALVVENSGVDTLVLKGGRVGIGTNNPQTTLSVQGSLALQRTPGNLPGGPGPRLSLQSPTNSGVTTQLDGGLTQCIIGVSCPTDTADGDKTSTYQCQASDAGRTGLVDVGPWGTSGTTLYGTINCVGGTASYGLQVTNGTLQFLNNAGASRFSIGQDGVLSVEPNAYDQAKVNFKTSAGTASIFKWGNGGGGTAGELYLGSGSASHGITLYSAACQPGVLGSCDVPKITLSTKEVTTNGKLTVAGDSNFGANLGIVGTLSVNNILSAGSLSVGGDFSATGKATIGRDAIIGGKLNVGSNFKISAEGNISTSKTPRSGREEGILQLGGFYISGAQINGDDQYNDSGDEACSNSLGYGAFCIAAFTYNDSYRFSQDGNGQSRSVPCGTTFSNHYFGHALCYKIR